jgi:hypothetical protein
LDRLIARAVVREAVAFIRLDEAKIIIGGGCFGSDTSSPTHIFKVVGSTRMLPNRAIGFGRQEFVIRSTAARKADETTQEARAVARL